MHPSERRSNDSYPTGAWGTRDWRCIGGRDLPPVEVAAPAPAVGLGPELPLKLHQAPDPAAIGADVRLDRFRQFADDGQVDAEQLRAPLQRRRDRPAQVGNPADRDWMEQVGAKPRPAAELVRGGWRQWASATISRSGWRWLVCSTRPDR
jgi:hypothetical protein